MRFRKITGIIPVAIAGLIGSIVSHSCVWKTSPNQAYAIELASDTDSTAADSEPAMAASAFAKIVGTEILDGVIAVEGRVSRTWIGVTVNALTDASLVEWQHRNQYPTATLRLDNSALGQDVEIERAIAAISDAQQRAILTDAFAYLRDENRVYSRYWQPEPVNLRADGFDLVELLRNSDIKASEYFSLLRDRNIARNLLLSPQKLRYTLSLKPAGYLPSPFEDDIFSVTSDQVQWEIKVYQATIATQEKIAYYRFAIRAVAEPHEFLIPISYWSDSSQPQVSAVAELIKEGGQAISLGEFNLADYEDLTLPQNTGGDASGFRPVFTDFQKTLHAATGEDAPNRFSNILSFIGGPGALSGLVGRALTQAPIQNNSIVTGGLINFEGEAGTELLVGVNQGFADIGELDMGVLFGATPESNASLFLGPSLRYSLLTFGVGARISGDNSLSVDPAGVLSIDVSRLIDNDPGNLLVLPVDNPRGGGTLGGLAGEIAQNQMIALISMEVPNRLAASASVEFTRTHTDLGCQTIVTPEQLETATFIVTPEAQHFRFLPLGCYRGKLNDTLLELLDTHYFYVNGIPLNTEPSDIDEDGLFSYSVDTDKLQLVEIQVFPK